MPDMVSRAPGGKPDAGAAHQRTSQAQGVPDGVDDLEPHPPAVDDYLRAVDDMAPLPPEAVGERLEQLKAAISARSAWENDEDVEELIEELTEYSYQVVRTWLAIIASSEGAAHYSRLVGDDVEQLAETVVSRAQSGFLGEVSKLRRWLKQTPPSMKVLHLLECLLELPHAYRHWQLGHRTDLDGELHVPSAHLDDGDLKWPIQRLHSCLTKERERVSRVMQTMLYNDVESAEMIEASLAAFALLSPSGDSR